MAATVPVAAAATAAGRPRWLKGNIKDKDYPRDLAQAGIGGTVWVRFAVETNGHATNCAVTRSSGHAELDEATCRVIEQRYRYKPAADRSGRPVRSWQTERQYWHILQNGEREPDDDEPDDGD